MRQASSGREWGLVAAVAVLITLTGALTSAPGALYAQVYAPEPGSNILDPDNARESYQEALRDADLEWGFAREPLVENEAATFTATLSLSDTSEPPVNGTAVQAAFENRAQLIADCDPECEFDISPSGPIQKQFRAGAASMTWDWTVVPRESGQRRLTLDVQPVLVVPGSDELHLAKINEVIPIQVEVHPNESLFRQVLSAAEELAVELPERFTVGRQVEVAGALPLPAAADIVDVELRLATGEGSARAAIVPRPQQRVDGRLQRRWRVTPEEAGSVVLAFSVGAQTQAGDLPLQDERLVSEVRPVAPSLWTRLQAPILWLSPVVGLVVALLTVPTAWRKSRAALLRRRRGDDEATDTPPEDEAGGDATDG